MDLRHRHTAGFAATLFVLVFAFTLRALIPAGYMPDTGGDSLRLVFCGPSVPAEAGGGSGDEDPAGPAPACAFAAAAGSVTGPADPPPLPRPVILAMVREPAAALRDPPAAARSEGPPPPARAPPLSI